ncbi:M17 family metallopeptidase [Mycoplasmopsis pulmonis]|uniref:M17 family metallopeptidase n=1 Tax=Mycoplasmopsis pulmonis TaxID=2107 RepID=UPI002ACE586B|nr:M17 family metallopeptidase [Mycoplasmopsis pulmonis]MDZ7293422.1 M17 family metallopeptidase [Mycoplasmopsis pulmonis]
MLLEKQTRERNNEMLLKAVFDSEAKIEGLIKTKNVITEFVEKNEAYVFLGKKEDFSREVWNSFLDSFIPSMKRSYQLDILSFETPSYKLEDIIYDLYIKYDYIKADLFSHRKKESDENKVSLTIWNNANRCFAEVYEKAKLISSLVNFARDLQTTPPNICNSEWMAKKVEEKAKSFENVEVKVLDKKAIEKHGMNLLLSVNKGSMFEPRVVVLSYNGDSSSKERTSLIGKGITFDSGGYSLKPAKSMVGMKYDMSGAAIVSAVVFALSALGVKRNVSAVLAITDNRVNGDANLPDSVWKSMNGKSVEINNTDAEGRLVMVDAMTYAIRELKSTDLIDVATLTGAIVVALGNTYTGVWSTNDSKWEKLEKASKVVGEKIWRMPIDAEFAKGIKKSSVADLRNVDYSGLGGSNSAMMFLNEFNEGVDHIHIDIAGTANVGDSCTGVMVKTLVEYLK